MTRQNKYVLYLGLADKDTKKQQITTSKAMKLVNQVVGDCTINKSKGYWQGFKENTLAIINSLFENSSSKARPVCRN